MNENFNLKRPYLTKEQRLPQCYKEVEKILKSVKSCQTNCKTALAKSRLRGLIFKKVYKLSVNVLKYYNYIQKVIDQSQLLKKEIFLRKEIATILVYELLFGNGSLPGKSKAVTIVQAYQNSILRIHEEFQSNNIGILETDEIYIPRYVRVHTLVTTVAYVVKDFEALGYKQIFYDENIPEEKFLQLVKSLEKGHFLVDFHFKDILVFAKEENLLGLDLYKNGHIFLQDKASYIPVHVLNPEPRSTVLDACAAPGMKTAHIASKMKNKGLLIACERDKDRFETLKEMLYYGSIKISKAICSDFKLLDPNDEAYSAVEYILLDPSCSGSGMVSRMDDITDNEDSKTKERVMKLAGFQIILLKHALKFPSVKRVVYSTCSIYEEENEYVVHEVLQTFGHSFKLATVLPEWSTRGSQSYECGEKCLRTVPKEHLTNGFFVAMFERIDGDEYQIQNFRVKRQKNGRNIERSNDFDSKKVESPFDELQPKVTTQEKKSRKRKEVDETNDYEASDKNISEENSHRTCKKSKQDFNLQQNVSSPLKNFQSLKKYENCSNSVVFKKQAEKKKINEKIDNKDDDAVHCSYDFEKNKSAELKKHKKRKKDKKYKNETQNLLLEQNQDELQIISPLESVQSYENIFKKQAEKKEINKKIDNKDNDVAHCSFVLEENKSTELKKHKKRKKDKKHKNEIQNLLLEQNQDELQIISPLGSLQNDENLETKSFSSMANSALDENITIPSLEKKIKHKRHHSLKNEESFEKSKDMQIITRCSAELSKAADKKSKYKIHDSSELLSEDIERHCESMKVGKAKHKKKKISIAKNSSVHSQGTEFECRTDLLVTKPTIKLKGSEKELSNMQSEYFENKILNESSPGAALVNVKKHKNHSTLYFQSDIPQNELVNASFSSSNTVPQIDMDSKQFLNISFELKNKKHKKHSCEFDTPCEIRNINSSLNSTKTNKVSPNEKVSESGHHEKDFNVNKKCKKHKKEKVDDSSKFDNSSDLPFEDSEKTTRDEFELNNGTDKILNSIQNDSVGRKKK